MVVYSGVKGPATLVERCCRGSDQRYQRYRNADKADQVAGVRAVALLVLRDTLACK